MMSELLIGGAIAIALLVGGEGSAGVWSKAIIILGMVAGGVYLISLGK